MSSIIAYFKQLDAIERQLDELYGRSALASVEEFNKLYKEQGEVRHLIANEAASPELRDAIIKAAKAVQVAQKLVGEKRINEGAYTRAVQRHGALRETLIRRINAAVMAKDPEEYQQMVKGANFAALLAGVA